MIWDFLIGWLIWRVLYVPIHHKMPWVYKPAIVIKRKKDPWER